jgi:hypothetical protein
VADNILAVANTPLDDDPRVASNQIAQARLVIDSSKWIASKLMPRLYGDRIQLEAEVKVTMTPLQQLRALHPDKPTVDV